MLILIKKQLLYPKLFNKKDNFSPFFFIFGSSHTHLTYELYNGK